MFVNYATELRGVVFFSISVLKLRREQKRWCYVNLRNVPIYHMLFTLGEYVSVPVLFVNEHICFSLFTTTLFSKQKTTDK